MTIRAGFLLTAPLLFAMALPAQAAAQVREVVVGITPICPYGLTGCWGGAAEGLGRLSNVESVGKNPDSYNSTGYVYLKKRDELPSVEQWRKEFKAVTNDAYVFRGVEITVEASVVAAAGNLSLKLAKGNQQLSLLPLKNKLQWNYKKNDPRQPEPDEQQALATLTAEFRKAEQQCLRALVTGPLVDRDGQPAIEVREFFLFKQN